MFGLRLGAARRLVLGGGAALLAALVGTMAAAQSACIIYEHDKYRGNSYGFSPEGESRAYGKFWNNSVSSVRVADGCRLTLFEDRDFRGDRITFEGNVSFVGGAWNDRASSSICECGAPRRDRDQSNDDWRDPDSARDRDRGGDPATGRGDPPRLSRRGYACNVYRGEDFRGPWRAFRDGEDDRELGRRLRDRVSSVEVARGCVALLDVGRDYKIWVDRDLPRLPRGLDDRTESVSCFCN